MRGAEDTKMTAETGTGVRAKRVVCLADTALTQLLIAIHERDTAAMLAHCENLAEWLDKGGFAPDMEQCIERARLEAVAPAPGREVRAWAQAERELAWWRRVDVATAVELEEWMLARIGPRPA